MIGRDLEEQAGDEGVDAHALALAGRAGDQQVRHARQVADDGLSGDVVAERKRQFVRALAEGRGLEHLADRDQARGLVGHFDSHRRLAGDGRLDTQRRRRQCERQVVLQRGDLLDLHSRTGLKLVLGHRRSRVDADDLA